MSHDRHDGYACKHPASSVPEEDVAGALSEKIKDGRISCAAAHGVAQKLGREPAAIGKTLDLMDVRLMRCQLGLFGYTPENRIVRKADHWDAALEKDILEALENDRLPCYAAWAIARRHEIKRLDIANVCEALGIKVKPCQLGAF